MTKGSLEISYQHDADSTAEVNIDQPDGGLPLHPKLESPHTELNTDTDLVIEGPSVSAALESSPSAEFGLSRTSSTDPVDVEVPNRSFQSSRKQSEVSFDAKVNASTSHSRRQSSIFASGPESREPVSSEIDLGANLTAVAVSNPRMAVAPTPSAKVKTNEHHIKESLEVESPQPKKKGIFSCCSPSKKPSKSPSASPKKPHLKPPQSEIMETSVDVDNVVPVQPISQHQEVVMKTDVETPELFVVSPPTKYEPIQVEEVDLAGPGLRAEGAGVLSNPAPSMPDVEMALPDPEKVEMLDDDMLEKSEGKIDFGLTGDDVQVELDVDASDEDHEKKKFGLGFDGSDEEEIKVNLGGPALESGVDFDFGTDEQEFQVDHDIEIDHDLEADHDLEINHNLEVDHDLEIDQKLDVDDDLEIDGNFEPDIDVDVDLKPDAELEIEPEEIDFDPVDESADVGVDINLDEYDSAKTQLFGTDFSKGEQRNFSGVGVSFEGHTDPNEFASKDNSFNLEGLGVENSGFNFGVCTGANEEEQKRIDDDRDERLEHKSIPEFSRPKLEHDNPKFSGKTLDPDENFPDKKIDVSFTRDDKSLPSMKKSVAGFGETDSADEESNNDEMRINFNANPNVLVTKPEESLEFGEISKDSGSEKGFNFGIDAAADDSEAGEEKEIRLTKKKLAPGFMKPAIQTDADADAKVEIEPEDDMFSANLDVTPETKPENLFRIDGSAAQEGGIKADIDPLKLEFGEINKSKDGDDNDDKSDRGGFNFGIDSGDGTEDTWAIVEKEARLETKKETSPIPSLEPDLETEADGGVDDADDKEDKDEGVNFGASGGIGGAIKKGLRSFFGGADEESSEVKATDDKNGSNDEQMSKDDKVEEEDDVGAVKGK